ncbi:MAG: winged helix-turn-helix domain-containing protein [Acidobacteria bacterium]|nr:winged helix-turn-helix domain-containing protein [Acidobacteriota bacterium]
MSISKPIQFGVFEVDLEAGELRKRGVRLRLQAQPFGVLAFLLERPGAIVSREELRQRLWPSDVFVDFDQGLNKAINKLREALGDSAESPRFIETVPRKGYRFIAPVSGATGLEAAAPQSVDTTSDSAVPPARMERVVLMAAAIAIFIFALALGGYYLTRKREVGTIDSIAVLPLVNDAHVADLDYLCEGVTESVTNKLSQIAGLRVMARSTVFHYQGKEGDPRAVGRELGVRAVLAGHVLQHDDLMTISVELTSVDDGSLIWGEQYNRKPTDILGVLDEIAPQIATALKVQLTAPQQRRLMQHSTEDSEAHQLYLQGRFYFNKRTDAGFAKATDFFQQAIAKDPTYGLAYAGLADTYGLLGWETDPPKDYFPRARQMAEKALAIDDQMAEAHVSLAMVKALYEWDWDGAEREFRRAIELNPGHATAHHWYGIHLGAMGRFEESKAELQKALELDPLSLIINSNRAYPYHYQHQYAPAIKIYRKAIDMDPNFPVAHEDLMAVYEQQGKYEDAMREAILNLRFSGDGKLADRVGYINSAQGYRAALTGWLDGLKEESKAHYVSPIRFAQVHTLLGDKDQALTWLGRAVEERSPQVVYLKVDPRYDRLRADPRFAELLRRVGLPQ